MSLRFSENTTTYNALSSRWGNTPAAADICAAIAADTLHDEDIDYDHISDRWGNGVPFFKLQKLNGIKHIFECRYVDLIDGYMVSECSANMLRSDIDHFNDFIKYQDSELIRPDLEDLDDLLVQMVLTDTDCMTLQGANCE
jgi:hypothetical protein